MSIVVRGIDEIIRQGQQAGEIRSDVQLKLLVRYIDLLRGSIVWEWLQDTSSFDLREEISKMVDIVLYGISSDEKRPTIWSNGNYRDAAPMVIYLLQRRFLKNMIDTIQYTQFPANGYHMPDSSKSRYP